jgi:hypothetical protein
VAVNKDFIVKNGLRVLANTASSNTTTGALVVDGGAGIAGDLHLGGQIFVDGTVSIQATSNADTFSIDNLDAIQFDTTSTITAGAGQLTWNADAGTLDLGLNDNVTLQVGQETHVHVKAGEDIADGDVVYASGAVGNSGQIEVSKFIADGTIEERRVIGIATESASSGDFFYVTSFGAIRGVSTDGSALTTPETWSDGTILYASPDVAGELTSTLPVAPNPAIAIAFVTSAHASNGVLFVRAYDPGFHLGELHDVNISSVANNQVLTYNGVDSRWENTDTLNLNVLTVANLDVTGSITGDLTIDGNLIISGNTTTVNTDSLVIEDLNITLASGAANSAAADGAGITIEGANAQITYVASTNDWNLNTNLAVTSQSGEAYIDLFDSGGSKSQIGGGTYGAYGNSKISFRTQEDSGSLTTKMVIIDDGSVGIGTTSPSYRLDVQNSATNALARIYAPNNSIAGLSYQTSLGHYRWSTQNTGHLLYNESVGHTVISFANTGNVSIPTGDLSVTNDISATNITATDFYGDLNGSVANTTLWYSTTTLADNAGSQGKFYFDALNQKLKVHTGSVWVDAVPAGSGSTGNTGSTDANTTFRKYTYDITSTTNAVSGADIANNTLSYVTTGEQNVEAFVNGVKQVEGASYDYVATTGTSVTFTSNLSAGDNVEIQVYELLTNDAYYLKTETYTQTETNSQISTALQGYVPATGGTFTGVVQFGDSTDDHTKFGVSATNSMMSFDSTGTNKSGGMTYRADRGNLQILTANTWGGAALSINHIRDDYQLGTTIDEPQTINMRVDGIDFGNIGAYANSSVRSMQLNPGTNGSILLSPDGTANVGIGTYTPASMLTLNGTTPYIRIERTGAPTWEMRNNYPSSEYGFSFVNITANTTPLFVGGTSGTVGINTTSPSSSYKLDVAGALRVKDGSSAVAINQFNNGATIWLDGADGDFTGGDYYNISADNYGKFTIGYAGGVSLELDGTTGHFIPGANAAQDLGSSTKAWRNIYTNDLHLSNEGHEEGNSVDGTKGNWTIQEGEDHLYIINNKNGKKYRFALEEIE